MASGNSNIKGRRTDKILFGAVVVLLMQILISKIPAAEESLKDTESGGNADGFFSQMVQEALYGQFIPGIALAGEMKGTGNLILNRQMESLVPFFGYSLVQMDRELKLNEVNERMLAEVKQSDSLGEQKDLAADLQGAEILSAEVLGTEELTAEKQVETLAELLKAENEAAMLMRREQSALQDENAFIPGTKQVEVDRNALLDYETLLNLFYTVDANTSAGSERLNAAAFMEKDMRISKEGEGPQILIFHTHSQETFADSVEGDASTSIVGVGERLAEILREEYGYEVLHHLGAYDVQVRDDAYSEALPEIEKLLQENPSIQVVIDLHRDQMPEGTKLIMDLNGRPTARFMFFNGLSRTKKTGNISYLKNENLDWNLAFSFQMQMKAAEYYPGLTRKIYLKGYRYNMHLMPRFLLVELGAQNNTVEEAMNACDPLAHILDMVLTGQS